MILNKTVTLMYEIWNSNEMKSVSEKRVTTSFRSMSSNDGGMFFWKFYWLKTDSTVVTEYNAAETLL